MKGGVLMRKFLITLLAVAAMLVLGGCGEFTSSSSRLVIGGENADASALANELSSNVGRIPNYTGKPIEAVATFDKFTDNILNVSYDKTGRRWDSEYAKSDNGYISLVIDGAECSLEVEVTDDVREKVSELVGGDKVKVTGTISGFNIAPGSSYVRICICETSGRQSMDTGKITLEKQ